MTTAEWLRERRKARLAGLLPAEPEPAPEPEPEFAPKPKRQYRRRKVAAEGGAFEA